MEETYRVRVQGHLDDRWSKRLEGLAVQRQGDGTTALVGHIEDQSALFGVLDRIRDLGLPLLSINREGPGENDSTLHPDLAEGPCMS